MRKFLFVLILFTPIALFGLESDTASALPLTGGTLTGTLYGTSAYFSTTVSVASSTFQGLAAFGAGSNPALTVNSDGNIDMGKNNFGLRGAITTGAYNSMLKMNDSNNLILNNSYADIYFSVTSGKNFYFQTGNVGISSATPQGLLVVGAGSTPAMKVASTGNVNIGGYTSMGTGNLGFKTIILSTMTGTVEGATTTVAHGLTGAKIVGWTASCQYTTNGGIAPAYTKNAEYQYDVTHGPTTMNVVLATTNSGNILDKVVYIIVYYIE